MGKQAFNNSVRAASATLTHMENYALAGAVVVAIAVLFGPLPSILDVLATAVALVWAVIVVASHFHQHDATLCVGCIEEVPANAPVCAQRRRKLLWFHHFRYERMVGLVVIPLLLVAPPLLCLVLHIQPSVITRMACIPAFVWGFVGAYAASQHRRLRPWCSYCRGWDEDGDHEPSPTPVEFGTKTLR